MSEKNLIKSSSQANITTYNKDMELVAEEPKNFKRLIKNTRHTNENEHTDISQRSDKRITESPRDQRYLRSQIQFGGPTTKNFGKKVSHFN